VSPLELSLAVAALLIGLTGAWSPCGFSMVETIGLSGDGARRRTTIASCIAFAPGAVVGGIATFGLLSALGELVHGVGGRAAYLVAAAIAIAAAVAEARGMRIVPQIRRQLPERWRWTMPMPLAATLYGILLGLGFTTFVLSFGVWALAGISVALGDPAAGLVIGAAFGVGRAIPVVLVAPVVDRRIGVRCIELMAERPALYRIFRLGDAVTLGLVAVALTTTAATAARTEIPSGADPSAAGKALAYQRADRSGVLRVGGQSAGLPGKDPALGGSYAAVISGGDQIRILNRFTRNQISSVGAQGVEAVAISKGWLAYLTLRRGRYVLKARRIRHPANPGRLRRIASVSSPAQIGHPSVDGGRVFYAVSKRRGCSIKRRNLGSGKGGTVVRSRTAALSNPSVLGKRLLYVRAKRARQGPQVTRAPKLRQSLILKRIGRKRGRRIYSHSEGRQLWSTSLSARRGFVTLLGGGGPKIVSVKR
jgi:MFS family permease